MTGQRMSALPSWALFAALGAAVMAAGVLLTFPGPDVWAVASWILAFALLVLAGLVLLSGWALVRHRQARTWPRVVGVTLGAACLAALAIGAI